MLAQQQLQLAIANPALHNLREAYRRVYQALDVDNIDALLKPDPGNPPPKSPAIENSEAMRGMQPKAFPQQNHKAHVEAHAEFMFTRPVQINPQLYAMMEAHVLQHIAIMAAEQIEQQMMQETQKFQQQMQAMQQQAQQNPQIQQQMQMMQKQYMDKKESAIATLEEKDPLVKLKQQEIDLKAAELMQKAQQAETDTVMRTAVESEKLDLQREKMQSDQDMGIMKESFGMLKEQGKETAGEIKESMAVLREDNRNKANERIANNRNRINGNKTRQNS
jgi:hypothetical protein